MTSGLPARRRRERGSSLVEFSLVLLAMLTVLFGIIEIGRLALMYTTLASAARSGTRYAIVHGANRTGSGVDGPSDQTNYSQVVSQVQTYTTAASMNSGALTVTVSYPNGNSIGSPVTVQLAYNYTPMVVLIPLTVTLSTTSKGYICF